MAPKEPHQATENSGRAIEMALVWHKLATQLVSDRSTGCTQASEHTEREFPSTALPVQSRKAKQALLQDKRWDRASAR